MVAAADQLDEQLGVAAETGACGIGRAGVEVTAAAPFNQEQLGVQSTKRNADPFLFRFRFVVAVFNRVGVQNERFFKTVQGQRADTVERVSSRHQQVPVTTT